MADLGARTPQVRPSLWLGVSPIVFGVAGLLGLVLTDLVGPWATHSGDRLQLSRLPLLLVSTTLPPALFAFLATYWWLVKGVKFFSGWLSVAMFAWISLVLNPVIGLLVFTTYMLHGVVVFATLLAAGAVLMIISDPQPV
jgi:hypothetical protein